MEKVLITLILIITGATSVLASDWRWIPGGDYIDLESVTRYYGNALYPHTNSYTYWLKNFDDGSISSKRYIDESNKLLSLIKNQNTESVFEIKTKEILDCENKKFTQPAKYFYDKYGNVLYSYSLNEHEFRWGEVVPDSNIDFTYKLICQPNKQ